MFSAAVADGLPTETTTFVQGLTYFETQHAYAIFESPFTTIKGPDGHRVVKMIVAYHL